MVVPNLQHSTGSLSQGGAEASRLPWLCEERDNPASSLRELQRASDLVDIICIYMICHFLCRFVDLRWARITIDDERVSINQLQNHEVILALPEL